MQRCQARDVYPFIAGQLFHEVLDLEQHAPAQRKELAADLEAARPDNPDIGPNPKQEMVNSKGKLNPAVERDRVRR